MSISRLKFMNARSPLNDNSQNTCEEEMEKNSTEYRPEIKISNIISYCLINTLK
jgi:hypothetical protein